MKTIWDHQRPSSCEGKKFLIYPGHLGGGFGSNVHVDTSIMAIAMNHGRIFLPHPVFHHHLKWPFEYPFCTKHNHRNFYCYWEEYSSCGYKDVYPFYDPTNASTWPADDQIPMFQFGGPASLHEERVLRLPPGAIRNDEYPKILEPVMKCANVDGDEKEKSQWWIAVATPYLLRPNQRAMHHVLKMRTFNLNDYGPVIGVYVRYGDKGAEMKLVPLKQYTSAILDLWRSGAVHARLPKNRQTPGTNGTIFLGTEDPRVIDAMTKWAAEQKFNLLYTTVLDRKRLGAGNLGNEGGPYNDEYAHGHHELEYLSMMLNLDYFMKCSGWVHTMGSNYNWVIDEMRNTVAGKADLTAVDLVYHTEPIVFTGMYKHSYFEGHKPAKVPIGDSDNLYAL